MARRNGRASSRANARAVGGDERTDARERALILLYEADTKGVSPRDAASAQVVAPDALTTLLVQGVEDHRQRIDDAIAQHSRSWTLARMPLIDLTVMRIAAFELLGRPDVPVAVVLDEAVELAKRFSTDDSGRFVNGVLSALVPVLRDGSSPPDPVATTQAADEVDAGLDGADDEGPPS
jgi:N utilization substance protein B